MSPLNTSATVACYQNIWICKIHAWILMSFFSDAVVCNKKEVDIMIANNVGQIERLVFWKNTKKSNKNGMLKS